MDWDLPSSQTLATPTGPVRPQPLLAPPGLFALRATQPPLQGPESSKKRRPLLSRSKCTGRRFGRAPAGGLEINQSPGLGAGLAEMS